MVVFRGLLFFCDVLWLVVFIDFCGLWLFMVFGGWFVVFGDVCFFVVSCDVSSLRSVCFGGFGWCVVFCGSWCSAQA